MVTIYFTAAIVIILLILLIRKPVVSHILVFVYIGFLGALCLSESTHYDNPTGEFFKADALGVLLLFVTLIISFFSAIHYAVYAQKRLQAPGIVAVHNASFVVFATAISGVFISTHIGMLS